MVAPPGSKSLMVIAGVDVSAKKLTVSVDRQERIEDREFSNDPAGHKALISWLRGRRGKVRVIVEATGTYGLDLCLALHRASRIEVMVVNPRAARKFAEACMRRGKSDRVDAADLREFARRMSFVPWKPPARERMELRSITRRLSALTEDLRREQNRLHALNSSKESSSTVRDDIEESMQLFRERIERLTARGLAFVEQHEHLARALTCLTSVKGIAAKSGLEILGELATLPENMTVSEVVCHAGLAPTERQSGTSLHRPRRISKVGNVHLRRALFMPAMVAVRHEPRVRAYFEELRARDVQKLPAYVAVMRKLLGSLVGMLRTESSFDGEKFRRSSPKKKGQDGGGHGGGAGEPAAAEPVPPLEEITALEEEKIA